MIKFKKPGKAKKNKNKMPPPPVEKHCRGCECDPEGITTRWCHAESKIIKFQDGGGIMGGRINHKYIAWLCFDCDIKYSHALPKNATRKELKSHADVWNKLIDLSH